MELCVPIELRLNEIRIQTRQKLSIDPKLFNEVH